MELEYKKNHRIPWNQVLSTEKKHDIVIHALIYDSRTIHINTTGSIPSETVNVTVVLTKKNSHPKISDLPIVSIQ